MVGILRRKELNVRLVVIVSHEDFMYFDRVLSEINVNEVVWSNQGSETKSIFSIKMTNSAYMSMMSRLQAEHKNLRQEDDWGLFDTLVDFNK